MKKLYIKHKAKVNGLIIGLLIPVLMYLFPFTIKPKLKFYLGSSSLIAKTTKKIDSLFISYKNRDITKDSVNLIVTRIRIVNNSRGDIKEGDYTSQPFGMKIYNCQIIGIDVIKNKDNYLSDSLKPHIVNYSTIEMNKLAFDCKDEVSIDVFIIHKWNQTPDYYAMGKIVGVKEIPTLLEGEDEYIDWEFVIFVGIIVIFELLLILAIDRGQKMYRKWRLTRKLNPGGLLDYGDFSNAQKQFIELYAVLGKKDFIKLIKGIVKGNEYLKNEKTFIDAYEKVNEKRQNKTLFIFSRKVKYYSPFSISLEVLLKSNLLRKDESGNFIISEELKNEAQTILKQFIS